MEVGEKPNPGTVGHLAATQSHQHPPAPTDAPPGQTTQTRPANDDDIIEMGTIAQKLTAMLPDWTAQAIASLACTVFIQRGK